MRQTRIPKQIIWGVIGICVLPFLLNLAGVDFGTSKIAPSIGMLARLRLGVKIQDQVPDANFRSSLAGQCRICREGTCVFP